MSYDDQLQKQEDAALGIFCIVHLLCYVFPFCSLLFFFDTRENFIIFSGVLPHFASFRPVGSLSASIIMLRLAHEQQP